MITDEEFDIIVSKYFAKIRGIGFDMTGKDEPDIIRRVEEMNDILERIKEIRSIQRRQRGEEDE